MLIRLTEAESGLGMTLSHQAILMCRKDPEGKIWTHVMTGIAGPRGLTAFQVKESPEEIALMCNAAERSEVHPSFLGLGRFSDVAGSPQAPALSLIPA